MKTLKAIFNFITHPDTFYVSGVILGMIVSAIVFIAWLAFSLAMTFVGMIFEEGSSYGIEAEDPENVRPLWPR